MINPEQIEAQFDAPDDGAMKVMPDQGLPRGIPAGPEPDLGPEESSAVDLARAERERKAEEVKAKISAMRDTAKEREKSEQIKKTSRQQEKIMLTLEQRTQKLDGIIAQIAAKQKANGMPVRSDCRIRMEDFENSPNYGTNIVNRDNDEIDNIAGGWRKDTISRGEMMEKITTALFGKFFRDSVFLRTSEFDDKHIEHGYDSLLFAENGSILAAFDEVEEESKTGDYREAKLNKVLAKNKKGGGNIKYCFRKGNGKILLGPEINVPVLALDLDIKTMERAIDNFSLEGGPNDAEKCAMYQLVGSMYRQIDNLEFLLKRGDIKFDHRLDEQQNYVNRFYGLKSLLENNIPREMAESYLAEQLTKSKGTSPKTPHKRRITRR